ncbi:hypothetical protein HFQ13_08260 [Acidithiobacillus sp. VAN18-1]|uniref:Uncharacterized protein n=1 Tax=Igneacidithiobacillus copahuensis TaxID=2724909 RepID=A0AAE3CJV1_9PROT|nr:hypothetical protein [Igneacidithiobacillus copahuensis]MBU2788197.1 hypothetical protein [Igneacidithiobacillus copahuensis]MBU2797502.1 hypothetical protein [Acidithiobacillus sp. VAN18-2]
MSKKDKMVSINRIVEIDEHIQAMVQNGAPASISTRLFHTIVTRRVAQSMASAQDMTDGHYLRVLVDDSIPMGTARRIVKRARAMAATIETPVAVQSPVANPAAMGTPAPVVTPASVTAPTSGGGVVVGKEKGAEAAEKQAQVSAQPEPAIQIRNGDENQAGDVWVEKAQKYVPKSKLISGFRKMNGDVWDSGKGEFVRGSSIKHGHVRIEDGWEWHSSLRRYRNPDRTVPDPWESDDPEINRLYRD